jgi:SAM-dependent methyltransferase
VTPTISCGVCGARDAEPLWTASALDAPERRYAVVRCTACGVARTDPQPPLAVRRARYDADYGGGAVTKLVGPLERVRRAFARGRARRIVRGLAPGVRVLDVGCGDGKLVVALRAAGVHAVGLEGSIGPARRAAAETGGRAVVGNPAALPFATSTFDAVVVWHVLEHLPEPRRTLAEVARCLRPGGILVVAVPDAAGVAARLGREAWLGLDVERHLYHFTARTLADLLAGAGFVVRRQRHVNVELAVIDLLDTALRRVGLGRFGLYQYLATGARRSGTAIVSLALATVALPFAFVGALGSGVAGRGTDVQIWAERPAAPRDATA